MIDMMQRIHARLDARDKLDALIENGGAGTIEHRKLDDMCYSSDVEQQIRFLLSEIEKLQRIITKSGIVVKERDQ